MLILALVITISAIVFCSGCSTITYTDKDGRAVKSTSLFTDRGPSKIDYKDGDKSASIELGNRSQIEALDKLKALAEAVK